MAKKSAKKPAADLVVENAGSICMLRPTNEVGRRWIEENVQPESWQWFGGALAVEPRYIFEIVDGAESAGLVVQ
jgi:hypothetical protein